MRCDRAARHQPSSPVRSLSIPEALTNVLRHAKAANAWITLKQEKDGLTFVIRDDGRGLTREAEKKRLSHGILGMRQRITSLGGEFRIESTPGAGTSIKIFIPSPLCGVPVDVPKAQSAA